MPSTTHKIISHSQLKTRLLGLVLLFIISSIIIFPSFINKGINSINTQTNLGIPLFPQKGFSLGLDLQGGAHLVYQAKIDQIPTEDRAAAVEAVRDVIERRVRGGLNVSEPIVQTTKVGNDHRVIVELPGVTNVNEAIQMIGETPILEFKEQNNDPPRELTVEEKKQLDDFNKAAQKKIKDSLSALTKGMNFADAVSQYSEDVTTKNNGGDIGFITFETYPELFDWAKGRKDGDVSKELLTTVEGLIIPKRLEEKTVSDDKIITASHILLCYTGSTNCESKLYATKEEARKKVEEIKKEATPKNFTDLAKKYSTDPGTAERGGDLGKFTKGKMVSEFEKAVWDMKPETISDIVETQYGFHLILKKSEEPVKEFRIARILVKTKQASDIVPPVGEWKSTNLSGKQLKRAEVVQDPRTGEVQVSLKFDEEGAKLFGEITSRNVGKQIAIFLDNEPISIAGVDSPILTGDAVIRGGGINNLFSARELTKQLNLGAIPVPIEILTQKKVDATLGAESLKKSFDAGLIGLIAIMLFMVIYYRLPGLLSVFSLAFYALLNLALFKLLGVTLTLSGIAGFILSIGMAVDANILVFERLKEEFQLGKSLTTASEESFHRSWPSIRDGHITALISCVFLMWFGSGFVQGFATVLAVGTIINLFTAITVTRTIMRLVFKWFKQGANWLFLGYKPERKISN